MNTGTISKSQINSLMTNNELISSTIQKYATLAVEFNMRKEGFQYNQTTLNAQKLALLFLEWDEAIFNLEKEHVISKVQELNSEWNSAIGLFDKNLNYRLTTPSWLELIENIENSTQSYLIENKIENIEVLWLERTKIK
ncbi:hypothetical protein ACP8HI_07590 [Paenibacillus sp. FA6]|uniref:hypothetical protein n=1 Tax=Paenibacillus sp. FA6 TaxID=3413029 RepID=UPI003F658109